MKAIGKGCFELIVIWAIVGYGFYLFFQQRFEAPGDLYGAIAGGMFVSWAWGTLRNVALSAKQKRMILQSRIGGQLVDGEQVVAVGTIRALREPLLTPFQKKEAVAFGYGVNCKRVITSRSSDGSRDSRQSKEMLLGGFAMTPCAVKTPYSDLKILGFSIPSEFPENEFPASQYRSQIAEHCANTKFTSTKSFAVGDMFKALKNALTDDDGALQEHWRVDSLEATLDDWPNNTFCDEQYIPNNSQVCVFGKFSAQKGGLLNDFSTGGLQIIPGDEKKALANIQGKITTGIIVSVIFLLIGLGAPFGILTARENSQEVRDLKREKLLKAVQENDIAGVEKLFSRGLKLNADPARLTPILNSLQSEEMLAMLVKHGFFINAFLEGGRTALINEVYSGNLKKVQMYLRQGADPNIAQKEYGYLPLEIAFDDGNFEMFNELKKAGAKGVFVDEKIGMPIKSDKGPEFAAIKKYLKAHVDKDSAAMREAVVGWPESFYESFERGLYDGTRSESVTFVRGYSNGSEATIFVTSPLFSAEKELWIYTLIKKDGVWKVRREGNDDTGNWYNRWH